eukprot:Colp12_sorted_trinity150504_noHs@20825
MVREEQSSQPDAKRKVNDVVDVGDEEERVHKCDQCFKSYRQRHNLLDHIRTHHEGRRFKCTACNKVVMSLKSLQKHQIYHCPGKPESLGCVVTVAETSSKGGHSTEAPIDPKTPSTSGLCSESVPDSAIVTAGEEKAQATPLRSNHTTTTSTDESVMNLLREMFQVQKQQQALLERLVQQQDSFGTDVELLRSSFKRLEDIFLTNAQQQTSSGSDELVLSTPGASHPGSPSERITKVEKLGPS